MRRRHSSHSWLTPVAEASVKAARFVRAAQAVGAKRRAFTDAGAEGTASSEAEAYAEVLLDYFLALRLRPDLQPG
jgi:hypothetical protein